MLGILGDVGEVAIIYYNLWVCSLGSDIRRCLSVDRFVGFVSGYAYFIATVRGRTTARTVPNQSCGSTQGSYTQTM